MASIAWLLLVAATISFFLAAINLDVSINLVYLGFALVTASWVAKETPLK